MKPDSEVWIRENQGVVWSKIMNIKDIKEIYSHMGDDISKRLFIARLSASITYDDSYIINLPDACKVMNAEMKTFKDQLLDKSYPRTVVLGAGFNGQYFVKQLLNGDAFAFIDNFSNEKMDKMNGLPIYRLHEYIERFGTDNTCFLISVGNRNASKQICEQLVSNHIPLERIIIAPEDYRDNALQYFDVFIPKEHEVFVDCGAYDGSSAHGFVSWCAEKEYDKIWCFEPDMASYERTRENCDSLKNCTVLQYGVSDCEKEVSFIANGCEDARMGEAVEGTQSGDTVKAIQLDDVLGNEKITFIKMDIEGEEYNALIGAKNIIAKQKPRLAISIYHRNEDVFTIPQLLLELVPEYQFKIRHYSLLTNETILYAY